MEKTITTIEQLLANSPDLANLPQVVMRLIDLTGDPKATAADIERIICTDQALAAKILALANSAYYGMPRRIASIREAVVFLGFKSIRTMAMSITTFTMFLGKSDSVSLARRAIWRHSLNTAHCARVVTCHLHASDRQTFGADDSFTGGLLHDIGKLLIDREMPEQFVAVVKEMEERKSRFHEVEMFVLPFNHALAGGALASRWMLPKTICETIAFHHTPLASMSNAKLAATVSLSNEIAHLLESGDVETGIEELLERSHECLIPLRLSRDNVQTMILACRSELDKGLPLLG